MSRWVAGVSQVDAVLDYDIEYADRHLGDRLPTSLQPDILDDRFEERHDLESNADTAMDPTIPLHVEFYLTQVWSRSRPLICKLGTMAFRVTEWVVLVHSSVTWVPWHLGLRNGSFSSTHL
jgi:hypothetical protein